MLSRISWCVRKSTPDASLSVRDPGSVTYSAAIESAATLDTSPDLSDFAARVEREANRRGFTEAQRQAVLGDGSAWIWNTASELFPQATQILDRFHAKEHLSQVGKVLYGDSPEGKPWIQALCDELDQAAYNRWSQRCMATPANAERHENVSTTSGRIDAACGIRSFTNKGRTKALPGVKAPISFPCRAFPCGAMGSQYSTGPARSLLWQVSQSRLEVSQSGKQ